MIGFGVVLMVPLVVTGRAGVAPCPHRGHHIVNHNVVHHVVRGAPRQPSSHRLEIQWGGEGLLRGMGYQIAKQLLAYPQDRYELT